MEEPGTIPIVQVPNFRYQISGTKFLEIQFLEIQFFEVQFFEIQFFD